MKKTRTMAAFCAGAGLAVLALCGTAAAQPSWWSSREEPPLKVNALPLAPSGQSPAVGAAIPVGRAIGNPAGVKIEVLVPSQVRPGTLESRTLTGFEAIAFLSVRDYIVYDRSAGSYKTTAKFGQVTAGVDLNILPIEPGAYVYGGASGTALVARQGGTVTIRLTYKKFAAPPDVYEITAQLVPGSSGSKAVGSIHVVQRTPIIPPPGTWGIEVVRDQHPDSNRLIVLPGSPPPHVDIGITGSNPLILRKP